MACCSIIIIVYRSILDIFTISFPKERWTLKALGRFRFARVTHGYTEINPTVFSLCVIDTLQTIFVTHYSWHVLVVGWGNPEVLAGFTWSTCTIPIVDGVGTFPPTYPSEFSDRLIRISVHDRANILRLVISSGF